MDEAQDDSWLRPSTFHTSLANIKSLTSLDEAFPRHPSALEKVIIKTFNEASTWYHSPLGRDYFLLRIQVLSNTISSTQAGRAVTQGKKGELRGIAWRLYSLSVFNICVQVPTSANLTISSFCCAAWCFPMHGGLMCHLLRKNQSMMTDSLRFNKRQYNKDLISLG